MTTYPIATYPPIPRRRVSILSASRPLHLSYSIGCSTSPPPTYDQAPQPRIRLGLVYPNREFRWVAESQCLLRLQVVRALRRIRNLPCCSFPTREASGYANELLQAAYHAYFLASTSSTLFLSLHQPHASSTRPQLPHNRELHHFHCSPRLAPYCFVPPHNRELHHFHPSSSSATNVRVHRRLASATTTATAIAASDHFLSSRFSASTSMPAPDYCPMLHRELKAFRDGAHQCYERARRWTERW